MDNNETNKVEEIATKEDEKDLSLTQTIVLSKYGPKDILKEDKDFDFAKSIEEKRAVLNAAYKKNKTISNIFMITCVALMVACFALIVQNNQTMKITGYCLGGVAFAAVIVYYIITRNKFPNMTKEYVSNVIMTIDRHTFNNQSFTEMMYHEKEKEEKSEIISDRVFKDTTEINSRNVCKGLFNKHGFKVSELAVYHDNFNNKRKKDISFLGKFISCTNELHFEGRIILSLSGGEKPTDLPTDIEDLKANPLKDGVTIYTSEECSNYEEILGEKFISQFSKFKLDAHLLNVNIVVWAGRCAAYLSYDDSVVALPFDKPFEAEPIDAFIEDLRHTLNMFELLK